MSRPPRGTPRRRPPRRVARPGPGGPGAPRPRPAGRARPAPGDGPPGGGRRGGQRRGLDSDARGPASARASWCPGPGSCWATACAGSSRGPAGSTRSRPGKRPLHNMAPMIAIREGRAVLAVGAVGGPDDRQQRRLDPDRPAGPGPRRRPASLAAPRLQCETVEPAVIEAAAGAECLAALRARGHALKETNRDAGNAHLIAPRRARRLARRRRAPRGGRGRRARRLRAHRRAAHAGDRDGRNTIGGVAIAVCSRIAYSHQKRPVRSSLLPPGEGGRDGRMRGPGPHRSQVLRREVDRGAKALIRPFGAPPGGEGDQLRLVVLRREVDEETRSSSSPRTPSPAGRRGSGSASSATQEETALIPTFSPRRLRL